MNVCKSVTMPVKFWEWVDAGKKKTGISKSQIVASVLEKGLETVNPELLNQIKKEK